MRLRRAGSVMLETVLAFPLVLVLMLASVQIAHLWMGRMTVNYAAYCAARAALVTVCDKSGPTDDNDSWATQGEVEMTGGKFSLLKPTSEAELWGNRAAAQMMNLFAPNFSAERKIKVAIQEEPNRNVGALVEYDMALVVPIAGQMIAWGMDPWNETHPWAYDATRRAQESPVGDTHRTQDNTSFPYVRLKSEVWMPKPYRTLFAAEQWAGCRP